MAEVSQKSFVGGEISPSLYARTDQAKYSYGLRTCRNFMVMRHGGVTNRPGTKWIGEVKDSTKTVRLIPFVFNSSQTYVLEFGNLYMRVIKNGAQVTNSSQNITGISNGDPGVLTYAGADNYANGDIVYVSGVVGTMANNINGRSFKVANVNTGANTFELNTLAGANFNTTSLGSWTSGGTIAEIYTLTTLYAEADLPALRFIQSADTITIVHPTYAPAKLTRSADNNWALTNITFAPTMTAPSSVSNSGAAGSTTSWVVTAVSNETGEESLQSSATTSSATPTSGAPITITIGGIFAAPGLGGITPTTTFNVYRQLNGIYGFIGSCSGVSSATFIDAGTTPDTEDTPPEARNPFSGTGNYPSVVAYNGQRIVYGNTTNLPETLFASRIGLYTNFTLSTPSQDDEAVTWTLYSRQVNEIKHLLEFGKLIMFTASGELSLEGDGTGTITPSVINPRQQSSVGSGTLAPLLVDGSVLFVQARQGTVRDLAFDFNTDGYRGNEISIFSSHLFEGYTITDWSYQKIPQSIVWAVRSDGTLLGLTYVKEQQILAWHRHDFQDATVENVCCVPEGTEDAVYVVVKRSVNGATVRYIERMQTRVISDIEDAVFMDSALTYDGTNAGATTMTLSGGTLWNAYEDLTLTASASYFTADDVGNRIDITSASGVVIRCTITAYSNVTTVTVHSHKDVPANLRSTARTTWTKAVDQVTGLWHLEGKAVSVFADGFVVANPKNAGYATVTVTNGIATLERPYGVIQVGLPIISDLETLDIDQASGETLANKQKLVTEVTIFTESSRGIWVGAQPPTDDTTDPLEGLTEVKVRDGEDYDDPVSVLTGKVSVDIESNWNSNGRVFIRQVDPIPLSVLAVVPSGLIPYGG